MSVYRIRWDETWSRQITVDLDEESLRYWTEVPIGPIPDHLIRAYLEETSSGEYEEWHPNTTPGVDRHDELDSLDVIDIHAPIEVAS